MMMEEECDLLIKNEKIKKLLERGNTNKYLTFKEINSAVDNVDSDTMDILFQLLNSRNIAIVEDKREFENIHNEQNRLEDTKFIQVEDKVGNNDDPIRLYLKEIGKVNLLTHDDEVEFSKKIESGESEIENIILSIIMTATVDFAFAVIVRFLRFTSSRPLIYFVLFLRISIYYNRVAAFIFASIFCVCDFIVKPKPTCRNQSPRSKAQHTSSCYALPIIRQKLLERIMRPFPDT